MFKEPVGTKMMKIPTQNQDKHCQLNTDPEKQPKAGGFQSQITIFDNIK